MIAQSDGRGRPVAGGPSTWFACADCGEPPPDGALEPDEIVAICCSGITRYHHKEDTRS